MTLPTTHTPNLPQASTGRGCLGWIIFVLAWFWVVCVTLGRLAIQLLASGSLTTIPDSLWASFPAIQAILLLIPLAVLAFLSRSTLRRAVYRLWFVAAAYVLLLAPVSLFSPVVMQLQSLLNILASLILIAVLLRVIRPPAPNEHPETRQDAQKRLRQPTMAALLTAALAGISWAVIGALGSPLDTILQMLAGLAFGLAATVAYSTVLLPGMRQAGVSYRAALLLGGFCAATALLVFASGVGYPFGGVQLLLAICLPPVTWLAIYLLQSNDWDPDATDPGLPITGRSRLSGWVGLVPAALLVGLSAAFPLVFIDPDELALVITFSRGELLVWSLAAAGGAALVGLLASLVVIVRSFLPASPQVQSTPQPSYLLPALAIFAWLFWLLAYFISGQPGFFGEELFVVMEDQITAYPDTPDLTERRSEIYTGLVAHANSSQAELRQALDRLSIDYTPYYLVNGMRVNGGPLIRLWLQAQPGVAQVLQNPYLRPLPQGAPQSTGSQPAPQAPQWNLTQIGADRVHRELGITGAGILIGQSDSGVQYDHPELADSYHNPLGNHNYAWYDPWNGTTQPADIGGHGTHTLGSVLGNTTGVAPDAEWIACANLARNLGNPAYYLDCMQFMLAPFPIGGDPFTDGDPARGPQVLNNSWGCPEIEGCQADTLLPAVQALNAAGIFVVVSAGNDGPFCESLNAPPAIYAEAFSVGANDPSGGLALFSSRGPVTVDGSNRVKPDLIAPGDQVLSAMPGNTYAVMSGTSMAGPHVAGTVALMWSANPALAGDIERTRQILASTAKPYPYALTGCPGSEDSPSTAVGYGLLDAYAAVQAALAVP